MLSRAKTLDGKMVEGYYYVYDDESSPYIHKMTKYDNRHSFDIEPSTLGYKIGSEWYSIDRLSLKSSSKGVRSRAARIQANCNG